MATVTWCGVAGRRVMAAAEQRLAFSSLSSSSSSSSSSSPGAPILCGRGDKKTRRGKIFKGSYGNARPKKEKKIERIKDKIEVPRKEARESMRPVLKGTALGRESVGLDQLFVLFSVAIICASLSWFFSILSNHYCWRDAIREEINAQGKNN